MRILSISLVHSVNTVIFYYVVLKYLREMLFLHITSYYEFANVKIAGGRYLSWLKT